MFRVSRKRREFGAPVEFVDVESNGRGVDISHATLVNFDLRRAEMDVGLQVQRVCAIRGVFLPSDGQ